MEENKNSAGMEENRDSANMEENSNPGIEECFARLDMLLEKMESEETGLEDSFRLYEEGLKLLKTASESIDRVEKKLTVLKGDGEDGV